MQPLVAAFVANFTALSGLAAFRETTLYTSCVAQACHLMHWEGSRYVESSNCALRYDYVCARPIAADNALSNSGGGGVQDPPVVVSPNAPPYGNYTELNVTITFLGDFTRFFHVVLSDNRNIACLRMCRAVEQTIGIASTSCTCLEGSLMILFTTAVVKGSSMLNQVLERIAQVESAGTFTVLKAAYAAGPGVLGGSPSFSTPVLATFSANVVGAPLPVLKESACGGTCIALITCCFAVGAVIILWVCITVAACAWGVRVTPKKVRPVMWSVVERAPPPPTADPTGREYVRRRSKRSSGDNHQPTSAIPNAYVVVQQQQQHQQHYAQPPHVSSPHPQREISIKYVREDGEDNAFPDAHRHHPYYDEDIDSIAFGGQPATPPKQPTATSFRSRPPSTIGESSPALLHNPLKHAADGSPSVWEVGSSPTAYISSHSGGGGDGAVLHRSVYVRPNATLDSSTR